MPSFCRALLLTSLLTVDFADFDFWFGGIADASPDESANAFSSGKRNKPDMQPDAPQQQEQVQDKKGKPAFKGKVKRVPGSLGRVFEPRQFDINM